MTLDVRQDPVGAFAYRVTYIQGWPIVRMNSSVKGFDVIILPSLNRRISKLSRTVAFDLILGKRPKPSSTLAALEGICIPAPIYRRNPYVSINQYLYRFTQLPLQFYRPFQARWVLNLVFHTQ
jgi:hypothetical protein